MIEEQPQFWVLIPAAGSGQRMQSDIPKQYLEVAGKTVLQHTVDRLASANGIAGLVLVTAPDDQRAEIIMPQTIACHRAVGGATRADTVLSGVEKIIALVGTEVWVLVHDAARPGVRQADVEQLMAVCAGSGEGGILAQPVRDTVKQAARDMTISTTLPREEIWLAQTPQCFKAGLLRSALQQAMASSATITDEASAMTLAGYACRLVPGHWRNMKLTEPEDMPLLEWILSNEA
ncbi:2-C-methyl-D-erythritol 4-phosphate cytidylyltransferase [Salinispirillum sp. LH 10-3-1]|uniref:2-C-methyl-D-erythritol 4-phosphate cytidylyltransferase n=1 Tax=Salinispirillum sp. LH 10-3-1 TaxID=2952525 RepID=A0AB38YIT3_9GAMM